MFLDRSAYFSAMIKIKGFTLIEMLISVAIFMTVSVIVVAVLFSSFRLSKKSDTLVSVKQIGDAALAQIVSGIKYAKTLDDPISCVTPVIQSSVTITSLRDDGQTIYSCSTSTLIASNGASLVNTAAVSIDACSFTCRQATLNDPPTISIQFTLSSIQNNFVGSSASIPFQASVVMRNYSN